MQQLKTASERIIALDAIRGFAVLGILLMNIQSFSMPGEAYTNPAAFGDLTGWNLIAWGFSHLFADQKFMSIFSMLFGASIVMITDLAAKKGHSAAKTHYSRNFWLLIIGLVHAYLIWYGDILTPYAVCAFLLFPARKWKVKNLIIVGLLLFAVPTFINLVMGFSLPHLPKEVTAEIAAGWEATDAQIAQRIAAYQGDYSTQLAVRVRTTQMMQTQVFFFLFFWRITGLMLLGMALYKSGFVTAKMPSRIYKKILIFVGIPSLTLVAFGMYQHFAHDWQFEYSMFLGNLYNYWGSLGMALSYISSMVLLIRAGKLKWITTKLANAGRMALTNYLIQSIICTIIFYGIGLFGEVARAYQLGIVLAIWLLQLWWSNLWMQHFKYGIFEWMWRSLTKMEVVRIK